jgi:two-component sensor histidine kinase
MFGYLQGEVEPSVEAWCARVHPEDVCAVKEHFLSAVAGAEPLRQVYRCMHPDGSTAWVEARGQHEWDSRGSPRRLSYIVMDVSEQKLAEERQRLMMLELHHRVKNSLANVQAIAGLTARTAPTIDAFQSAFNSRIQSLGRTHTMLVSSNWQYVSIDELMQGELLSLIGNSSQRYSLTGPSLNLPYDIALSIGLVIHELATNAVKHGALSVPKGRIEVSWSMVTPEQSTPAIELRWVERDGPPVCKPTRYGFGSTLLSKIFAAQAGSSSELRYLPEGLQFRAVLPCFARAATAVAN